LRVKVQNIIFWTTKKGFNVEFRFFLKIKERNSNFDWDQGIFLHQLRRSNFFKEINESNYFDDFQAMDQATSRYFPLGGV